MKSAEFAGYMTEIEKFYNKPIPREAKNRAWDQIHQEAVKALYRAVDRMMMEHTGYMPPMQKIIDMVREEGRKILDEESRQREEEARREKEAFRRGQAKAFSDGSKVAQASLMLIGAILARKLTRGQIIEKLNDLDLIFPEAGFREQSKVLKGFYAERQLPMDRVSGA